ncbi:MAG: hypothetical protein ACK5HY_13280 [Parahaliea sp.]
MSTEHLPGRRRLLLAWVTLMLLTVVSMLSALTNTMADWRPLPLASAGLVLLATGFKAQQILMVYLNLRVSSRGWKTGALAMLLLTLAIVALAYLAGRPTGP